MSGPTPTLGSKRAEGVVRHALPFADVVGEPSAESELPEDVVHHEVRVVARVETTDGGEPVGDVRLRLPWQIESRVAGARARRAAAEATARRAALPDQPSSSSAARVSA